MFVEVAKSFAGGLTGAAGGAGGKSLEALTTLPEEITDGNH